MVTKSLDEVKEMVCEEGYSVSPHSGDKVPPSKPKGWNRRVKLCKGEWRKEIFVRPETWEKLKESEWFKTK